MSAPGITFEGQVAVVTGAGSGIGEAVARLLAERGAKVVVNDPAPDGRAERVASMIRDAGGTATSQTSPVGSRTAAAAIVARALDAFGGLHVLVNNAGIAQPGRFDEVADEAIDQVLAVNLNGPYALMRAAWPILRAQGYGRIVNMSSSAALGSGISGPYAASKAAIIGLTKDAALAGRNLGIHVNAIMPSAHTPLIDNHPDPKFRAWMQANLPAAQVAAVVAYLASRDVTATGEIYAASGGLVTRVAFVESRGCFDRDLTPEIVRDQLAEISDLHAGSVLSTQDDHQAVLDACFPGRPGAV